MTLTQIQTMLLHKVKSILPTCLMLVSFFSFSQNAKIDTTQISYQTGLSFEMHNTKNYGMSFGGVIGRNIGNKIKPNYLAGLYFDVVFVDKPIVAPRLKITLNYLGFFGVNFCFANYYRDNLNDFRITPEINFSLYGKASVFLGYNIGVSKHKFTELGDFKLGLNINLTN